MPVRDTVAWLELSNWGRLRKPRVRGSLKLGVEVGAVPKWLPGQTVWVAAAQDMSEVENRNIKKITDTFTLVQVVDVIVVSGRWRKSEEGGKHCREHQAEVLGQNPQQSPTPA